MLVLSRQRDESIIIGDNIVVTIVDIRGDKSSLGINAPTEIPVHRQEIYQAIQREICALPFGAEMLTRGQRRHGKHRRQNPTVIPRLTPPPKSRICSRFYSRHWQQQTDSSRHHEKCSLVRACPDALNTPR